MLQLEEGDIRRSHPFRVIWMNQGERSLPRSISFPNTSIQMEDGNAYPNWDVVDLHCQTLKHYLEDSTNEVSWSDRISLMKKIGLAIQHKHEMRIPHGKLSEECITVRHGDVHPFIWPCKESGTDISMESDIQQLGKIFHYILTNGKQLEIPWQRRDINENAIKNSLEAHKSSREKLILSTEPVETVMDLLDNIGSSEARSKTFDIKDVLRHPTFWSPKEKCNYLTMLFDSLGHKDNHTDSENEELNEVAEIFCDHMIFKGSWVEHMKLTLRESTALNPSGNRNIYKDLLCNLAIGRSFYVIKYKLTEEELEEIGKEKMNKEKWKSMLKEYKMSTSKNGIISGLKNRHPWMKKCEKYILHNGEIYRMRPVYDEDSLYGLLRFIRNRKAHSSENNLERQYYKDLLGFWNFYSKRFPKLLVFLYGRRDKFPYYEESGLFR